MSEEKTNESAQGFKLPGRFKGAWSRIFGGRKPESLRTTDIPKDSPQRLESPYSDKSQETISRTPHIGTSLIELLKRRGIVSASTGEFEEVGVAAMGRTNERGDPYLFESIKKSEKPPNGYLIGIGAGNVFSMLEAFPEDVVPKAIILFDVDPEVVKFGENLIRALKENPDKLLIDADYFERKNPTVFLRGDEHADPKAAIIKYVRKLAQLAQEGNLVIAQADFNNPQIAEQIANLPGFKSSNNVVYLSNISDHLWRRNSRKNPISSGDYVPEFSFLQSLTPDPPNQNYYIDTLCGGLDYRLRVDTEPPKFTTRDFDSHLALLNWQVYPHDKILYPNQPDPVWEDIGSWDVEKIKDAYRQLLQKPRQQERMGLIEEGMNRVRQHELQHYPESKEKARHGIFEEYREHVKYVVPETEEEEQSLLVDLQQPYDYQRDFLPFIAANFWGDAKTPLQIYQSNLPKRQVYHKEGDIRYWRKDPRSWTKGKVELGFLEGDVPYEEVGLAKLYSELARRVKDKNPQADIKSKNFEELLELWVVP